MCVCRAKAAGEAIGRTAGNVKDKGADAVEAAAKGIKDGVGKVENAVKDARK